MLPPDASDRWSTANCAAADLILLVTVAAAIALSGASQSDGTSFHIEDFESAIVLLLFGASVAAVYLLSVLPRGARA